MSDEKVLALITASEATKRVLCSQLTSLLDGYMKVEGYATESGIDGIVHADLIVLSSKMMAEEAEGFFDENPPVIVANRSLNLENIDELFHIPKGTDVLVVNDELENAIEIGKLLCEIGIDYLNYIPYAPGYEYSGKPRIAVTPGETKLVPRHITTVIDIKARLIDITTIIEILSVLGLLDEKSRLVSAKYMETIIRLNKQLHDSIEESANMNQYLVKVLNQVNDGIIAFSDNGTITVFNEKSSKLLGIKSSYAIGLNIDQLFRDKSVCDFLLSPEAMTDEIHKIYETEVIINKFRIPKINSTVCTLKSVRDTIDLEKKLRQNLIKKGFVGKYRFENIIGSSDIMKHTKETAIKLAGADSSILISGESGVGKELFASAIHNSSPRRDGPFLAVNFSALSEELAESELFGYEEGAFTGASKGGRIGLFEQANEGTIFLDEIGDVSLRIQARLLRVLQEKEIRRVGGSEIIPVNVRVLAATNKNLAQMCQKKLFREDLYYRLRKLYLEIPPLRDHISDLEELVDYFKRINGRPDLIISDEVMDILYTSPWHGNVRELANIIEYFSVISTDGKVEAKDIPKDFFEMPAAEKKSGNTFTSLLYQKGNPDEFNAIIRAIYDTCATGKAASRKCIADLLVEQFPYMSEDRIRRRTDVLKEAGLIFKKAGPGGMRLTPEGHQYLRNLREEYRSR